jgi:hypothetical protein
MTALRNAIRQMRITAGTLPRVPDFPVETVRALKRLEKWQMSYVAPDAEEDAQLLQRVRPIQPEQLSSRDIRRSLPPAWRWLDRNQGDDLEWLTRLTTDAVARASRPIDRSLVMTWLDVFPEGDGADVLANAARTAAERYEWPYRPAGREFNLWDHDEAAQRVGKELLTGTDADAVLRRASLHAGVYSGNLVQSALTSICDEVADSHRSNAATNCENLLGLLTRMGDAAVSSATRPLLVRALLKPWANTAPDNDLRVRIQRFALKQYGDPRFDTSKWSAFSQALQTRGYSQDMESLKAILLQWLNRAAFEIFFKLIGQSTSAPEQWAAREEFWRHYLEHNHIKRAYFMLGSDAERRARPYWQKLQEAGGYGLIDSDANPDHSAFLMEIGDVIIAEWTHNGSSCFWKPDAVHRPIFGAKRYDGSLMRATDKMKVAAYRQAVSLRSDSLWIALPHNPPRSSYKRGWHSKFAFQIREWTGIRWTEAEW